MRKHDSAMVMNVTFNGDVGYKRVYILDPKKGWIGTDDKYSRHSRQSINVVTVDYYYSLDNLSIILLVHMLLYRMIQVLT